MAINDVRLYGQVSENPTLRFHKGDQMPYRGTMNLKTWARFNNSDDIGIAKYDEVTLETRNPDMLLKFAEIRANDILYIKGVLNTADIGRSCYCPEGHYFKIESTTCYVHPIHIAVIDRLVPDDKGYMIVRQNAEISNECILDGYVCTDVHYSKEYNSANYKIAVKRSFRIIEDPAEKKTDYPVICTYFKQAESDSQCIHNGTRMNVRGSIRSREVVRNVICPECGASCELQYYASEVVANYVGYTANWEQPVEEEVVDMLIMDDDSDEEDV